MPHDAALAAVDEIPRSSFPTSGPHKSKHGRSGSHRDGRADRSYGENEKREGQSFRNVTEVYTMGHQRPVYPTSEPRVSPASKKVLTGTPG